jgi:hypothetical protein
VAETYLQALTRILPSMVSGLRRLGWEMGRDYYIGQRAPAKIRERGLFADPYEPPLKWDYFIHFKTGAGIAIVSQDRPSSAAGLNTDYILGDEVKYLDYPNFLEVIAPTMRANRAIFGHLPYHWGITMLTSMPTTAESKWIFEKESEMDYARLALVEGLLYNILKLTDKLRTAANKTAQLKLSQQINKYTAELNYLQTDLVYYCEAQPFGNLPILTDKYYKKLYRNLPSFIFETEILNKRPRRVMGGFYPTLDINRHTYGHTGNNSYLESLAYNIEKLENIDSRADADCLPGLPIYAGIDWRKNNWMVCGQLDRDTNTLKVIKNFYALQPEFIEHLVKYFANYYSHHPTKILNLGYGQDGNNKVPNSNKTYSQDFADQLIKFGWTVNLLSKGKREPPHFKKYQFFYDVFKGGVHPVSILFNRFGCKEVLNSMLLAPAKDGKNGIEKNKASERNAALAPVDTTNFSDAFDILACAVFPTYFYKSHDYIDYSAI